jgi:hypothetical protein
MFILQDSNGSSELQEIMRRRQEKISAAASDSGVESFDEGSSHWVHELPYSWCGHWTVMDMLCFKKPWRECQSCRLGICNLSPYKETVYAWVSRGPAASVHISLIKTEKRVGEMAQQVKVLAAKPNDPSSSPWVYMVGESWLLQVVLWSPHINK